MLPWEWKFDRNYILKTSLYAKVCVLPMVRTKDAQFDRSIFETSHRLHPDAESWWHKIKKSSRQFARVAQTRLVVTLRRFLSTIPFTEQDTHYLFMRSAPRPSSRPWHQAGHLAHLQRMIAFKAVFNSLISSVLLPPPQGSRARPRLEHSHLVFSFMHSDELDTRR